MSSRPRKPPTYRLHKPTGQAVVRIDGRDYYLGKHGTEASHERYQQKIAEWLRGHRAGSASPNPPRQVPDLTVNELILAYWEGQVRGYYVKDGRPTSEQDNIRQALRFLRRAHGGTRALEFGPLALKEVRESMIAAGRCRRLINKDVHRVRAMFRWAVAEQLYPGALLHDLVAVTALEKGRSAAKERPPVAEVPEGVVTATLPHLSPQVGAMVRLQLLTAARPGEVASIRPCDVDRSDPACWAYRPASHKTQHRGRERVVLIGPRAQEVLGPWLERDAMAYCFSPAEVVAARTPTRQAQPARARTGRTAARPRPGGRYTKDSYRVAVLRACRRAGVPAWTPHRLRHTRATEIRRQYDLEAAQIVLGHASADVTQVYAERDMSKARDVMKAIG